MGYFNGNQGAVYLDDNLYCVTNWDLSGNTTTDETTNAQSSGWEQHIIGYMNATGSFTFNLLASNGTPIPIGASGSAEFVLGDAISGYNVSNIIITAIKTMNPARGVCTGQATYISNGPITTR